MSEFKDKITPDSAPPVPYAGILVSDTKRDFSNRSRETLLKQCEDFMAENPGVFTPKLIKNLQYLDMKKPDFIPAIDWRGTVLKTDHLHELMCYMAAWGMQNREIAKAVARSVATVGDFLGCRQGRDRVHQIQARIWGQSPKKWITQILPVAIKTALDIMIDPKVKASTRLEAASKFMDRELGKPLQKVEFEDSLVRKVYELLDRGGHIDAVINSPDETVIEEEDLEHSSEEAPREQPQAPAPAEPVEPKDKVDEWVDTTLGKI